MRWWGLWGTGKRLKTGIRSEGREHTSKGSPILIADEQRVSA